MQTVIQTTLFHIEMVLDKQCFQAASIMYSSTLSFVYSLPLFYPELSYATYLYYALPRRCCKLLIQPPPIANSLCCFIYFPLLILFPPFSVKLLRHDTAPCLETESCFLFSVCYNHSSLILLSLTPRTAFILPFIRVSTQTPVIFFYFTKINWSTD